VKYVVVGGLTIDNILSASGERRFSQFGGNAAYGAAGARIWATGEVGMVARKGGDFPDEWMREVQVAGIDVSGVTPVPGPHLLTSGMIYDDRGDRDDYLSTEDVAGASGRGRQNTSLAAQHRAQEEFGADKADIPARYNSAKAVFLAARYLNKQRGCAKHFREVNPHAKLVLDPSEFYMHLERSAEIRELFGMVDVVLPSETEIRHLLGPIDLLEGAKYLNEMLGARVVVVKAGMAGCIVYDGQSRTTTRIPIFPVYAKDPTGAGDSFCGGFLVGLQETGDPVRAAMYGTVSSSFIVEHFGASATYAVTRREAELRLAHLKNLAL